MGPKLITQIPKKTNDAMVSVSTSKLRNTVGRVSHSYKVALLALADHTMKRGKYVYPEESQIISQLLVLASHHFGGGRTHGTCLHHQSPQAKVPHAKGTSLSEGK